MATEYHIEPNTFNEVEHLSGTKYFVSPKRSVNEGSRWIGIKLLTPDQIIIHVKHNETLPTLNNIPIPICTYFRLSYPDINYSCLPKITVKNIVTGEVFQGVPPSDGENKITPHSLPPPTEPGAPFAAGAYLSVLLNHFLPIPAKSAVYDVQMEVHTVKSNIARMEIIVIDENEGEKAGEQ